LSTFYDGARPNVSGYNPMRKQGAIILGTGGDNSDGAQGTFYEGVMTSGYPSSTTDAAVQANIVAAGYGH
ncbi:alpha-L-arabinofuranosidase, partial [Actinocrinis puniceicyclus]